MRIEKFKKEKETMKKTIGLIITAVFLFMQVGIVSAATRSFTLTATIPLATGTVINAASVNVATSKWTALASGATAMSFDSMAYDTANGYYAPDHYFAVDVGTTGGAGNVTTVVKYTEGNNPNSTVGRNGLGHKTSATFMKVTPGVGGAEGTETQISKKKLSGLNETISPTAISGGWLRVYLGIVTDPASVTGSEIFSNSDRPGSYTGTITFTSTVA